MRPVCVGRGRRERRLGPASVQNRVRDVQVLAAGCASRDAVHGPEPVHHRAGTPGRFGRHPGLALPWAGREHPAEGVDGRAGADAGTLSGGPRTAGPAADVQWPDQDLT